MLPFLTPQVKLEPMFYKLSTLTLFNQILASKKSLKSPEQKELLGFIDYCLKKMFRNLDEYPMLYIQILFSKSKRDCLRIMDRDLDPESAPTTASLDIASDDDLEAKKKYQYPS
jgi:replication fork protection complex subunit Tof1/Swi1